MTPGEYLHDDGTIELNAGRTAVSMQVNNTGDRPVQVGSHYHFFEVNKAMIFDRGAAYGMRLDIPGGTAVRFEPGEIKTVQLIPMAGTRQVYGGSGLAMGKLDDAGVKKRAFQKLIQRGFGNNGELPSVNVKAPALGKPAKAGASKRKK